MIVGVIHKTKNYGDIKITKFTNSRNVEVVFIDTGYKTKAESGQIRKGNVKDRLYRSVWGVGFVGDGSYNSKNTLAYSKWCGIFGRCYSSKLHEKKPMYKGCSVCEEWHDFQRFAAWFDVKCPKQSKEYDLDKDLKISNNKVYCPDSCLFIHHNVNTFLTDNKSIRGKYMIGVNMAKNKKSYEAYCGNPSNIGIKKNIGRYIGAFKTELEAHKAWRAKKAEYTKMLADKESDKEVKSALLNYKYELDNWLIYKDGYTK